MTDCFVAAFGLSHDEEAADGTADCSVELSALRRSSFGGGKVTSTECHRDLHR
jgi:hypothetical protein